MNKIFIIFSIVFIFIFHGSLLIAGNKSSKSANIWVGSFSVPTGSIIAWVPDIENQKNELDKQKKLPENFLVCNGPHKVDDPKTKFDERKIPKINAKDVFKGVENDSIIFIIKVH